MKRARGSWFLTAFCLMVLLSLVTGCYREVAPDVTLTSGGGADTLPRDDGEPDLVGTAAANSTAAAQTAQASETDETPPTAEPSPTKPAPTPTLMPATPVPTTVPLAPTVAPATPVPMSTPAPSGQVVHVVQAGENLYRIALRYGTTQEAIAAANGIVDVSRIYVGQALTIPSPGTQPPSQPAGVRTYVVQAGDNLYRIALRYNMTFLQLAQYNGITNASHVYVGQVLRIPPQ